MPDEDDEQDGALSRLRDRLDAFDARRSRPIKPFAETAGAGEGWRLLGTLIGGVLCGLGLGWGFDHIVGSAPFGLIGGLLVGAGVSIYSIARSAVRSEPGSSGAQAAQAPPAETEDDGG